VHILTQLKTALADPCDPEREIGRGGMAAGKKK
jgi:hypothetical protein